MRIAPIIPWLAAIALAQSVQAIDAEPPAVPNAVSQQHAGERLERTAYVGIFTSVASPTLREQLGLPRGVGVVVDAVENDSPALASGLAVHDVITKLDDQVIVNVDQFSVLIRLHKKGDTVKFGIIRHGKPVTVAVPLAERMLPPGDDLNALLIATPKNGRLTSIATQSDGTHNITLTTHGDDCHVRIADLAGKLLYEGPLNTAEDADKLPADCRDKVLTMQKSFEHYKQLRNQQNPVATTK